MQTSQRIRLTRGSLCFLILMMSAVWIGCPHLLIQSDNDQYVHDDTPTEFISAQLTGNDTEIREIATNAPVNQTRTIKLTVNSGQSPISSLFFQFTNTSGAVSTTPKVRIVSGANNLVRSSYSSATYSDTSSQAQQLTPIVHDAIVPQPLHLANIPPAIPHSTSYSSRSRTAQSPSQPVVRPSVSRDDSRVFFLHLTGSSETLFARAVRTIGDWTVVAWVHPDVYVGCSSDSCLSRKHLLNQSDVNAIMDAFFKDGDNNDIFDWVTALTGPPWGEHDYDGDRDERNKINEPNWIISGDTRSINLVLTDIGKVGYATRTVVGYFAGTDTRVSSDNRALMLYLHAPWAKFDTDETYQQDIFYYYFLSTLAHEFQHLVHFYQRTLLFNRVLQRPQDPTWLNEQYSLIVEDIVAQKIIDRNSNGLDDRGVNGLGAGHYPICHGRLPDFGAQSYYGISRWGNAPEHNEPFINYAVNYSFGNFLLRNYSRDNRPAYLALSYDYNGDPISTIEAGLGGDTIADAVTKWGTAILLSDDTNAPIGYRVNNGRAGFEYTYNRVDYLLGSTNYYNYATITHDGECNNLNASGIFAVYNSTERLYFQSGNQQHGHSNIFYEAGKNFNGVVEFVITLPVASRLSVIAKRQENASNNNPVYF